MITEKMIVDAVRLLLDRRLTMSQTLNVGDKPNTQEPKVDHGMPTGMLVRSLLSQYSLADIESIIRWLEVGGYVGYAGWGMSGKLLISLSDKGVKLAENGQLEAAERQLVYREDPYSVFVARQFRNEDIGLFEYLRDSVLAPMHMTALDGSVDGIEAFRGEILRKIGAARFFVSILTQRAELRAGGHASSVWLYQEIGAAVAMGKKPLVLVEAGLDSHYAGELQKNYEYVPFERGSFHDAFEEVGRRIMNDLVANHIPPAVKAVI